MSKLTWKPLFLNLASWFFLFKKCWNVIHIWICIVFAFLYLIHVHTEMCILRSGEINNVQEIGCKIIRFFFCVWFLCFSFFFSSAKSLNLAGPGWARLFFLQSTTNILIRSWQDYLAILFLFFPLLIRKRKERKTGQI